MAQATDRAGWTGCKPGARHDCLCKKRKSLAAGRATIEDEFLGLWQVLRELDVQAGIGEYGCLLLGVNDGADTWMSR